MSETKAAFAERAIQSIKDIFYRYLEDYGENTVHKLPQFASSMKYRINRYIRKSLRDVKNTHFLSIFYNKSLQKPLMRYKKPKFKFGDRVRISKNDLSQKGYKPQFTDEIFRILAIFTKKPPLYINKDLHKEESLGKFYEKEPGKRSD